MIRFALLFLLRSISELEQRQDAIRDEFLEIEDFDG